jgi:selenide,water dikinase
VKTTGSGKHSKTITPTRLTQHVAAGGCAAKLGPADLQQILHSLPRFEHPDMLVGTETSDDAGVFRLRPDLAIVNTVDFFTPIVDDPYTFGQIAAANALSDIFAMGAVPTTALNIVAFPKSTLSLDVLAAVLQGGAERVRVAGAVVIGGHSIIDEELKYGIAVTGTVHPDRIVRNVGVRDGDALILTKALGTGIITTGLKQGKASKASVRAAIASMIELNKAAASTMRRFRVHACSDVTGFSLLGHSHEMASGSDVTIVLEARKMPLLPGARRLVEQGCVTGGCRRNRDYLKDKTAIDPSVPGSLAEIALDPQTSGGLLIALSKKDAPALLRKLHANGVERATIVGHATAAQNVSVRLV